jgi:prevent-host-death family protein
MDKVGAYEAKTNLSKLLDRVAAGERITITRHGVPVAVLQPPASKLCANTSDIVAQLKAFRKNKRLGGLSIKEMIAEGRD